MNKVVFIVFFIRTNILRLPHSGFFPKVLSEVMTWEILFWTADCFKGYIENFLYLYLKLSMKYHAS